MTHKSAKIAAQVRHLEGSGLDARYLGYFECFNRQLFYESHDVLEDLWLESRGQHLADYYKGLIQLSGAFLHLQKGRYTPAVALFKLARSYLQQYAPACERLDLLQVLALIDRWLECLRHTPHPVNPLSPSWAPHLALSEPVPPNSFRA